MQTLRMPPELEQEKSEKWTSVYWTHYAAYPAPVFSVTTACLSWETPAVVTVIEVEKDEEEEAAGSL